MLASEIVFEAEETHEGGYEGWALGHSIYTQGETAVVHEPSLPHALQILGSATRLRSEYFLM